MKAVVFVCLLSLSMCLSQPSVPVAGTPDKGTPPAPAPQQPEKISQNASANKDAKNETTAPTTDKPVVLKEEITIETTPHTPKQNAAPLPSSPSPHANETTPVDNKTIDSKPSDNKPSENPKTEKTDAVIPVTTPAHEAKTGGKDTKPDSTTEKAAAAKTTEAPKDATEKPPVVQARGFDGPSFIGGIVLTLGLLAIGFMGFKYYRNQTERNYHTL